MSIVKITCPKCRFVWPMISESKLIRSNPQNRYFHGVIVPLVSEATGYTLDEAKSLLKTMFLKEEYLLSTKTGPKEVFIVKDTAKLKTDEFEVFTESCRRWAAGELGINIPEPNE